MGTLLYPPQFIGWTPIPAKSKVTSKWLAVKDFTAQHHFAKGTTIEHINKTINHAIAYVPEARDEWRLPDDTMRLSQGDCEDFAILKRAILISLGVQPHHTFLVVAREMVAQINHAVLAVYLPQEKKHILLDNMTDRLLSMQDVKDVLQPIIAFGPAVNAWIYAKKG